MAAADSDDEWAKEANAKLCTGKARAKAKASQFANQLAGPEETKEDVTTKEDEV